MDEESNIRFFKKISKTAIPVTLQNMISAGLGLIDILMIGQLGETSISSVGVGNQYFMIFFLAMFGLSSGAQIYLAQYWGDKNLKDFHKSMGVIVLPGLFFLALFFIPAVFAPKFVISLFSSDPMVIKEGSKYIKIAALGFPFHLIIQILSISFRSIERARFPLFITSLGLMCNTGLNFLLIKGRFSFPALGVKGAAIATLISVIIAFVVMLTVTYFSDNPVKAKLKEYFNFDKDFFVMINKAALPITLNEMLWALGSSLYAMAFSQFSTDAFAAYQIQLIIKNLIFTFGIGLAISNTITIGNLLGAGELEEAQKLERKFTKLTLYISIISGLILFATSNLLLLPFHVKAEVTQNAISMIRVEALFVPLKFYTLLHLVGTLRAGGDSFVSVAIDMSTMYLIGVPLAFVSLHIWGLPLFIAYALICSEELIKAILCFFRIRSKKWVKNLVSDS